MISFSLFYIQEECFTELRTVRGLGYVVICQAIVTREVGEFHIIIQSAKFMPNYVIRNIDSFTENFYSMLLTRMSIEYFELILDSLNATLSEEAAKQSPSSLWNKVNPNHSHCDHKDTIAAIPRMNLNIFQIQFFEYIINKKTRRKLTILLYGKGKETYLKVDCNISYKKINQTILDLDHACI